MELERDVLVSPTAEVPVVEGEMVTAIRELASRGVGQQGDCARAGRRASIRSGGICASRSTAGQQVRPAARRLTDERRGEARTLYDGPAGGNAVVVQRLLAERGLRGQRADGRARGRGPARGRSAWPQLATVRVETAPGDQLQIDFGQKRVQIAGTRGRASFCWSRSSVTRAASSSKRFSMSARTIGARASPAAFTHFGGVPRTLLGDNARALVLGPRSRDRDGHLPSGLSGLLSRLGRAAARVRAVSRADQRQDRSGREIREAQCAGGRRPSRRSPRSSRTWPRGWTMADQRVHGTTHEAPMRALRARRARGAAPVAGARAAAARAAAAPPRGARCLRRCRHGALQRAASPGARPRRGRRRGRRPSGSSTAPTLVATHAAIARAVRARHRCRRISPACGGRPSRRSTRHRAAGARSGRDLADYAARRGRWPMSVVIHARVVEQLTRLRLALRRRAARCRAQ